MMAVKVACIIKNGLFVNSFSFLSLFRCETRNVWGFVELYKNILIFLSQNETMRRLLCFIYLNFCWLATASQRQSSKQSKIVRCTSREISRRKMAECERRRRNTNGK